MPRSFDIRCRGWLRLLRPPNLLTVPGDPIAGFVLATLAGAERSFLFMIPAAGASLLLYVGGLVSNDCFDYSEDVRTRPDRPLPSGAVPRRSAMLVSILCLLAGVGLASLIKLATCIVAAALATSVLFYNGLTKRSPVIGSLNMGTCRGLSLLLGAVGAGWLPAGMDVVLVAGFGLTLYVAGVTLLASQETERVRVPVRRWIPAVVALAIAVSSTGCSPT